MLSGRTSVYIDTTKTEEDADMTKPADDNASQTITHADETSDETDSPREVKKKKPLDRSKYGKFAIHFGKRSFQKCACSFEN